MKFVAGHGTVV